MSAPDPMSPALTQKLLPALKWKLRFPQMKLGLLSAKFNVELADLRAWFDEHCPFSDSNPLTDKKLRKALREVGLDPSKYLGQEPEAAADSSDTETAPPAEVARKAKPDRLRTQSNPAPSASVIGQVDGRILRSATKWLPALKLYLEPAPPSSSELGAIISSEIPGGTLTGFRQWVYQRLKSWSPSPAQMRGFLESLKLMPIAEDLLPASDAESNDEAEPDAPPPPLPQDAIIPREIRVELEEWTPVSFVPTAVAYAARLSGPIRRRSLSFTKKALLRAPWLRKGQRYAMDYAASSGRLRVRPPAGTDTTLTAQSNRGGLRMVSNSLNEIPFAGVVEFEIVQATTHGLVLQVLEKAPAP